MPDPSRINPVDFRGRLCAEILSTVAKGESCTVIGVGSSGKSNVARHLIDGEVRARALGAAGTRTVGVYCNFGDFSSSTPQSLQLVLLEALRRAPFLAAGAPEGAALKAELTRLWEAASVAGTSLQVFAHLRDAVELALTRGAVDRIFFVLDDFDKVLACADASALNSLRKLRDDFKTRLTYVVVAWKELHHTRKNTAEYKDFFELVCNRVFPVGPYDVADAQRMIDRLASAVSASRRVWPAAERERMVALSGGHAGILAMVYEAADRGTIDVLSPGAASKLAARVQVSKACETIWESLDGSEQAGLVGIIDGARPGDSVSGRLQTKGLLIVDGQGLRIFSPVFEQYLRNRHGAGKTRAMAAMGANRPIRAVVVFQVSRTSVVIDNRTLNELDPISYALLEKLVRAEGRPVTPRELLEVTLSFGSKAGRFHGSPETRRDLTLEHLVQSVNLPDRKYITVDADGTYRFS